MEQERFKELVGIMARLADGDEAAVVTLLDRFGGEISSAVWRELRRQGVGQPDRDDVRGLTIDACFAIARVARSWDPERGALPWNYASRRIMGVVKAHIGQHSDELDEVRSQTRPAEALIDAAGCDEEPVEETFANLIEKDQGASMLALAFDEVGASSRDRKLLLDHTWQEFEGDPSPANTLAEAYSMSAVAVRKAVSRLKLKIGALVERDERFIALRDLGFLT